MHHTHKNHHILKKRVASVLMLLPLAFFGCGDSAGSQASENEQWYYGQLSERSHCESYVTVKHLNCGQGVWGGYWLQLDNGDFLQPTANTTQFRSVHEGDRYRICFENGAQPKIANAKLLCSKSLPAASPIRITFLEVMPKTAASTAITSQSGTPRFKRALLH